MMVHAAPQGVARLHREAGVGLILHKVVCLLYAVHPSPVGARLPRDGCDVGEKLEGRKHLTARITAAACLGVAMGGA